MRATTGNFTRFAIVRKKKKKRKRIFFFSFHDFPRDFLQKKFATIEIMPRLTRNTKKEGRNGGRETRNRDLFPRSCHQIVTLVTLVQPFSPAHDGRENEYLRSMRIGDASPPPICSSVSFNGSRTITGLRDTKHVSRSLY